jgi:hypothetical protein
MRRRAPQRLGLSCDRQHLRTLSVSGGNNGASQTFTASNDDYMLAV